MYQFKCLIPAGYTGHARATPAKMNLFEYVMTLLSWSSSSYERRRRERNFPLASSSSSSSSSSFISLLPLSSSPLLTNLSASKQSGQ